MLFRLFLDLEVVDLLNKLPVLRRRMVFDHLRKIQDFPGHYSDCIEQDAEGRRIDVSFFDGLTIHYWIDMADRHVKIMRILENE